MIYNCEWCGRFYSSPLPEPSSCPNHIPEWNKKLSKMINEFNQRITFSHPIPGARVKQGAHYKEAQSKGE